MKEKRDMKQEMKEWKRFKTKKTRKKSRKEKNTPILWLVLGSNRKLCLVQLTGIETNARCLPGHCGKELKYEV